METILIIDNDEAFRKTLKIFIPGNDYSYLETSDAETALEIISNQHPGLIITNLFLPRMSGLDLLKRAKNIDPGNKVVILTECEDINTTIAAMQYGAFDCMDKSTEFSRLTSLIRKQLESKKVVNNLQPVILPQNNDESKKFLVGNTLIMKELFRKIGNVSANKVNILIQGESGTGKELVAKTIHNSGITKDKPFVGVNCTVLSETLLESELFGHVKGAFTGAIKDKKGKFELAGNGTLFLDEISEISLNLQVKLLRVLQEKEFEKVGGEITIPMQARIIAASNKNLKKLVEQGKFREDLFYRLNVFTIEVPPLRERKDDIPRLAVYFLNKINKDLNKNVTQIPYEVMNILQNHRWSGNVRELENVLTQAVVLAKGDVLEKEYLLLQEKKNEIVEIDECQMSLAEMEKRHILNVLSNVNWNKQRACRVLKVSKATLYSKIRSYNLEETASARAV